jgi:hypothetical protein
MEFIGDSVLNVIACMIQPDEVLSDVRLFVRRFKTITRNSTLVLYSRHLNMCDESYSHLKNCADRVEAMLGALFLITTGNLVQLSEWMMDVVLGTVSEDDFQSISDLQVGSLGPRAPPIPRPTCQLSPRIYSITRSKWSQDREIQQLLMLYDFSSEMDQSNIIGMITHSHPYLHPVHIQRFNEPAVDVDVVIPRQVYGPSIFKLIVLLYHIQLYPNPFFIIFQRASQLHTLVESVTNPVAQSQLVHMLNLCRFSKPGLCAANLIGLLATLMISNHDFYTIYHWFISIPEVNEFLMGTRPCV